MTSGWLDDSTYDLVTAVVPIAGIDLLAVRRADKSLEYCLIERLDREERRGLNLIGGRIEFQESIAQAVDRHLRTTLGTEVRHKCDDFPHPVSVTEYLRRPLFPDGPTDSQKHQISLNFIVAVSGDLVPTGEALALKWFSFDEPLPDGIGFGQRSVVSELVASASTDNRSAISEKLQALDE